VVFSDVSVGRTHTCGLDPVGDAICVGDTTTGATEPPTVQGFVKLQAGADFTCGLRATGGLACWGPQSGFLDTGTARNFPGTDFELGNSFGCGIKPAQGVVDCWGANLFGNVSDRPTAGGFVDIAVGGDHACALDGAGAATCWGRDNDGQTNVPAGEVFTELTAGQSHTCGRRTDGTMRCWGSGAKGQLDIPAGMLSGLTAGIDHTCGLGDDGEIVCWGRNDAAQTTNPRGLPFVEVAASTGAACALRENGKLSCWGDPFDSVAEDAPDVLARALDLGANHACAIEVDTVGDASGRAVCWGDDTFDQLSTTADTDLVSVKAGNTFSCALDTDGDIVCWGQDAAGQLDPPLQDGPFSAVDVGTAFACAVQEADGALSCWGAPGSGRTIPPTATGFVDLGLGGTHGCAFDDLGAVTCWGSSSFGESNPTPGSYVDLGGTLGTSCGVTQTGAVVCWGGSGGNTQSVFDFGHATVDVSTFHTCTLRTDGSVSCFGDEHARLPVLPAWTVDRDRDGLSDDDELLAGTDPDDWDSDGDGIPDGTDPVP